MSKPQSTAKLLNMPEEQQAKLAEWLLSGMPYYAARELCIKEFNVTAGLSAFSGFWSAVCSDALILRRRKAVNLSNEVALEASKNPGQFDAATIDAIKQKAFELAVAPSAKPGDVKQLFALILKAKDQEGDKEQRQLDREKFEHLKRQEEKSKAVLTNATLTPEEKQLQMKQIFGLA
jgi:hypothetical protein